MCLSSEHTKVDIARSFRRHPRNAVCSSKPCPSSSCSTPVRSFHVLVHLYMIVIEQVQMGDSTTNLGYRFYPNALCLEVRIKPHKSKTIGSSFGGICAHFPPQKKKITRSVSRKSPFTARSRPTAPRSPFTCLLFSRSRVVRTNQRRLSDRRLHEEIRERTPP